MADVIDLTAERNQRTHPDPEFACQDDYGRKLYLYALGYEFDGCQWAAEVWAYSQEDAEGRVAAMRQSLTLHGQIYARIPA